MASPEIKRPKVEEAEAAGGQDASGQPSTSSDGKRVHDMMPQYYAKLFPHQHMYKWLCYGNDGKQAQADGTFFQRRELCFTLDGDIFVRYQAFKDGNEMADAIRARCPAKIDIGPVYTANPQDRLKFGASFRPVERELVFDVDLTDYDDVRTCGSGGHICHRCWPLMAVAVKIVDAGLRQEFGWSNILWVYSGRRGIHCWVCDPSARALTDEQRSSVAAWFSLYKGHEEGKAKIALPTGSSLHPAVERAAGILRGAWTSTLLPAQRLLESQGGMDSMLRYVPEEAQGLADTIRTKWAAAARKTPAAGELSVARWRALEEAVGQRLAEERAVKGSGKNWRLISALEKVCTEAMMGHAYPRLDVEVSRKMNHLLKAPFCVHPKTGKVCVPLDPCAVDEFDPDASVPTVASLLAELAKGDAARKAAGGEAPPKGEEWRNTAMADAVRVFDETLMKGLVQSNKTELAQKARATVAINQMHLDY